MRKLDLYIIVLPITSMQFDKFFRLAAVGTQKSFLQELQINLQNLQNPYLRRKRTEYYGILPLRVQILLKLGTHVASYGVFSEE